MQLDVEPPVRGYYSLNGDLTSPYRDSRNEERGDVKAALCHKLSTAVPCAGDYGTSGGGISPSQMLATLLLVLVAELEVWPRPSRSTKSDRLIRTRRAPTRTGAT